MKRKVSLIGPSTLMVSLPSKWVKENNIKKGDELEILEDNKNLKIVINKTDKKLVANFDVSNLDKMLYKFVAALYKAGFDEVKLIYNTPEQLKIIYGVLNQVCIGYEIVEEGNKFVIIKQISEVKEEDFENVLRRLFQLLISISEDGLKAIEKNDKSSLNELTLRDYNINKNADFCRRCLNKNKAYGPIYHIIEQLERIGDAYKDMFNELTKNKKQGKEIINYYKNINIFLNHFHITYYKYNDLKLEEMYKIKKKLDKDSKEIYEELGKDDILEYLNKIKDYIFEMNGSLMIKNLS
nr:phosphate uptake regulator PhoU [Candidatus Woesearchaeota archaeon]